jgi:hypothetical protein
MSKKKNILITFILGISLIMPVPLYAQTTSSQEDGVTINNTPAASVTVEFNKNDNGKKAKSTDSSQYLQAIGLKLLILHMIVL